MTYWDEKRDSHVQIWNSELYPSHWAVKHEFNEVGYRCEQMQSSDVVFVGSCDVMTNLKDGDNRWAAIVHKNKHDEQPFITLGTVAAGLQTMIRRLCAYIKNFGPPKFVYLSIPRFEGYEFVTKSGKCYNATRTLTAEFAFRAGMIDAEDMNAWIKRINLNNELSNIENCRYILEERFTFLEMICRTHGIKLKWSMNPSDAGIFTVFKNVEIFEGISNFMKDAFVGLPFVVDHQWDRSIGIRTHAAIAELFLNPMKWNYEEFYQRSKTNFEWLEKTYTDELVKGA